MYSSQIISACFSQNYATNERISHRGHVANKADTIKTSKLKIKQEAIYHEQTRTKRTGIKYRCII